MDYFFQQLINGADARLDLRAHRHRLHDGVRHHRHGEFRPWRRVHAVDAFIALIAVPDPDADPRHRFARLRAADRPLLGMALTALWSWAIERIAYRPLRGSFRLAPLISAIGMSIFLSNFVQVAQGPRNKPVPLDVHRAHPSPSDGEATITISYKQVLIVGRHGRVARRLLVSRAEDAARPRAARLRAGSRMAALSASMSTAPSR